MLRIKLKIDPDAASKLLEEDNEEEGSKSQ